MDKRSFLAGALASAVGLVIVWMATGGRYVVMTHSRLAIRTDRLTGKTHMFDRDQWHEITTSDSPLE